MISLDGPGYVNVAHNRTRQCFDNIFPASLPTFQPFFQTLTIAVIRIISPFRTYTVDSIWGYLKNQQEVSPLHSSIKRSYV